MAWQTSTRAARLPADWHTIRAEVKRRAGGRCQALTHEPDCDGKGTDADHIRQGDDHALTNLQWLSASCHAAKTRAENAARNTEHAKLRRRPTETHPGRRQP